MKRIYTLFIGLFFLFSVSENIFAQGKVHVIGMTEQNANVYVTGISADGTKVTGYELNQSFSFLWTKENGLNVLDMGKGGSGAIAVSNTGVVVGQFADTTLMYEDPDYGMIPLLSAGYFKEGKWNSLGLKEGIQPVILGGSMAEAISADGKIIAGSRKAISDAGKDNLEPVIWTLNEKGKTVQILDYKQIGQGARITCMSADGKVAGGFAAPYSQRTPVIWIDGKMHEIKLNGVSQQGEVHGISANGRYAALSLNSNGALYDIKEDRITIIDKRQDMIAASATSVSDNGFVLGYHQVNIGPTNREAFIYSESLGEITLTDYLEMLKIKIPEGLTFVTTMGISADGKKLIGFGQEGWYMVGWYIEIDQHLKGINPARNLTVTEEALGKIKLSWEVPSEEGVTQWLTGYNIYRNEEKINDALVTKTTYEDNSLENGTYRYKVTAVYGENESRPTKEEKISTALIRVPFYDDFASANMDSLYWNVSSSSAHWQIDGYGGINPPSLVYFNPVGSVYEESIYSPWIEANYTNDLQLSFNLLIPHTEIVGNDSLRVDVYDGENWQTVARYAASEWMVFSFEPQTIDISKVAAGKVTRIRFSGYGDNDGAYLVWGIDNVNVYTSRDKFRVETPLNVTAYRTEDGKVRLNWTDPKETAVLSYLPSDLVTMSIGNEGKPLMAVNKFEKEDLIGYQGYYLTHISAYLNQNWGVVPATYRIVVFKGDKKVVSQDITDYKPNEWNTFALKKTIFIDSTQPLYFGIEVVSHDINDWPIGTSDGVLMDTWDDEKIVINDGRSNLYSEDGGVTWKKLTGDGMNESVAIKASISRDRSAIAKERLMGYRVYRDGYDMLGLDGSGNRVLIAMNHHKDLAAPTYACCYEVTAFYTTQEESEMSASACVESIEGNTDSETTGNTEIDNSVDIYVSNGLLYVQTDKAGVLSIYTASGQLHSQRSIAVGQTTIQLSAGMYIVQINDTVSKVVIGD